jgi:stress response protein YsnF
MPAKQEEAHWRQKVSARYRNQSTKGNSAMPDSKSERSLRSKATADVVPVVEEELRVSKRQVVKGRVRVRTVVDTVEEVAREELRSETIEVTRVPIDREVTEAPAVRTEGDVTIVPVLEEVLVVEKRLVLKEELHLRRKVETETFEAPVTLRKQRVEVERLDEDNQPLPDKETQP